VVRYVVAYADSNTRRQASKLTAYNRDRGALFSRRKQVQWDRRKWLEREFNIFIDTGTSPVRPAAYPGIDFYRRLPPERALNELRKNPEQSDTIAWRLYGCDFGKFAA